jgi:hypothetical protein
MYPTIRKKVTIKKTKGRPAAYGRATDKDCKTKPSTNKCAAQLTATIHFGKERNLSKKISRKQCMLYPCKYGTV